MEDEDNDYYRQICCHGHTYEELRVPIIIVDTFSSSVEDYDQNNEIYK